MPAELKRELLRGGLESMPTPSIAIRLRHSPSFAAQSHGWASARVDYEYERNGTANLFMIFEPLAGKRRVKVTDRRTALDFAEVICELVNS
jgi:hypothetical protein